MSYEYNPKSNVVFGNVDLSDYNAYAVYCNIFDRPERDISVVSVPGRNGDLIFDNGRYKNVDRTYQIHVVGVENVHNLIRDLVSTVGYQRLEDEYDPNVYMMARLKNKPNVRKFVGNAVLLTVTFDRMPQRWDKNEGAGTFSKYLSLFRYQDGEKVTYANSMRYGYVNNTSDEVLKPTIKLHSYLEYASSNISFYFKIFIKDTESKTYDNQGNYDKNGINVYYTDFYDIEEGQTVRAKKDIFTIGLTFTGRDGYIKKRNYNIVIDSEAKVVYDDDTKENLNKYITSYDFVKFPEIQPGYNHIYIDNYAYNIGYLTSFDVNMRNWSI